MNTQALHSLDEPDLTQPQDYVSKDREAAAHASRHPTFTVTQVCWKRFFLTGAHGSRPMYTKATVRTQTRA